MNVIRSTSDRRQAKRYSSVMPLHIRFSPDGAPIDGACVEIGPNGMRVLTSMPLVEATYVHAAFLQASNNTHCEGRVVWTRRDDNGDKFESGIDVQHWGGGIPGEDVLEAMPALKPKKDRRKRS